MVKAIALDVLIAENEASDRGPHQDAAIGEHDTLCGVGAFERTRRNYRVRRELARSADLVTNNLFSKGPVGPRQGFPAKQRKWRELFKRFWAQTFPLGILLREGGPYT